MRSDPPWLSTCIGVEYDLPMLPHFIRHYLGLGIVPDRMLVILNARSADAPELAEARDLLGGLGVTAEPIEWIAPYTSATMWAKRAEVQTARCQPRDWVLNADVDEFQRWPEALDECLARADAMRVDCIQGVMIDRLAPGGALAPVRAEPAVEDQFPIRAEVAQSIGGASAVHNRSGTVKMMAGHARILPSLGGHGPETVWAAHYLYHYPLGFFRRIDEPAFRFWIPTQVDHYHWTDTLVPRLEKRLATPGVSPGGAEYGRRQLDHIRAHGGISLDHVTLEGESAPENWTQKLAVLRRMGQIRKGVGTIRALARKAVGR